MSELLMYHAVSRVRKQVSEGKQIRQATAAVAFELRVDAFQLLTLAEAAINAQIAAQAKKDEAKGKPTKKTQTEPAAIGEVEYIDAATTE